MEIKRIETYRYDGQDFSRLRDIKDHVENKLGAIIDGMDVTLTPKQKLNILTSLAVNKTELKKLLQVEIDMEPNEFQGDVQNILDIGHRI